MKYLLYLCGIVNMYCLPMLVHAQLNTHFVGQLEYVPGLNDVWGYAANNREYALVGARTGTSIVDVTIPSTPVELHFLPGPNTTWRDLKTWGNYAYVSNEEAEGILIIDLSGLPDAVSSVSYTGGFFDDTEVVINSAHNVFVDEQGILYVLGSNYGNGGAIMLDVAANPTNPPIVGIYDVAYVHDCFARGDTLWTAEIYEGHFSVVDISDKSNPIVWATQETPSTFAHNIWISDDGNYAFTTDEVSSGYIGAYDVSDLSNIFETDRYQSSPGQGVIPHNTFVQEQFLVTSYYADGLNILDATYPNYLVEVGNYDTSPTSGDGYTGAWGAYPYLPSRNILISDREEGLFIIAADYTPAAFATGLLVDAETGAPVYEASLQLSDENGTIVTSGFGGDFLIGTHNNGLTTLTIEAYGYETFELPITLINGETLDLETISLTPLPSFWVQVEVFDAHTLLPLPNASLHLESTAVDLPLLTPNSNADGIAMVQLFTPSAYTIHVGKWGYRTKQLSNNFSNADTISVFLQQGYYDDFFFDMGWTVSGNASAGHFERVKPIGYSFGGGEASPAADSNNDYGNLCYVTGNSSNSGNNVNNGFTDITSPIVDLSTYTNPQLNYYRWAYFQGASDDMLVVNMLLDGSLDSNLEMVVNNDEFEGMWHYNTLDISEYTQNNLQINVLISDLANAAHIVEGAFDAFEIVDAVPPVASIMASETYLCNASNITFYNTSLPASEVVHWYFEGAMPSESTAAIPTVWYEDEGTYDVTLVVTNAWGTDSITLVDYITVTSPLVLTTSENSTICLGDAALLIADSNVPASFVWSDGVNVYEGPELEVQPIENTTYTLTATTENGCTTQETVVVMVTEVLYDITQSVIETCTGEMVEFVLDTDDNNTVEWMDEMGNVLSTTANFSIQATETTMYTYTLTTPNGCSTSDVVELLVNELVLTVTQTPDFICNDVNADIEVVVEGATPPISYTWEGDNINFVTDSVANIAFFAWQGGISPIPYTVTAVDALGCTSTLNFEITVYACPFATQVFPNNWHIYPNPSPKQFILSLPNHVLDTDKTMIRIYNQLGQQVYQATLLQSKQQINLPQSCSKGIYTVLVEQKMQQYMAKLMVY